MDFVEKLSSDYLPINNEVIRTKFTTESEIEKWVAELMNASKVTWSITRTVRTPYEKAKKHTFKRTYHCHFNTNYRSSTDPRKKKHVSRNLSCPAMLTIILAYAPKYKSRSKSPDVLAEDWPCKIQFSEEHNHTILSATALIHRPIGETTKQEILEYFERGHSVSSAYHSFYLKKMEEWGEEFNTLSVDRHYFPNKTDFQNILVKHFKQNYSESQPSTSQETKDELMDIHDDPDIVIVDDDTSIETKWTDFIRNLNEKVTKGLRDDPLGFTLAIQSCITSYETNITSSCSLMSSLYTLFKSNDQRYTSKRNFSNTTTKGKKIGVQPTSVARRKPLITSRRKLLASRHTVSWIKKRQKLVHSQSECEEEKNTGLEDEKSVK